LAVKHCGLAKLSRVLLNNMTYGSLYVMFIGADMQAM